MFLPAALLLLAPSAPARATLSVCFLGDRGHHVPRERCQAALAPLRERGIDLHDTEDTGVLRHLEGYDALLVYANLDTIDPGDERALVEWVRGGGGRVAVHCASYWLPQLGGLGPHGRRPVPAARRRVFRTRRLEHPLTEGLAPLESWDETYVHHRHNPDRTVLAVREDAGGDEPWTWCARRARGACLAPPGATPCAPGPGPPSTTCSRAASAGRRGTTRTRTRPRSSPCPVSPSRTTGRGVTATPSRRCRRPSIPRRPPPGSRSGRPSGSSCSPASP